MQRKLRRREKYKKLLWESIEIIKQKLGNKVYRISLFDSFPQRADIFSYLDILIVMRSDKDFVERTKEIYSTLSLLYMQISSAILQKGSRK
jgi:hypothetical protein